MAKREKDAQPPIPLDLYRQLIYDCADSLMREDCDKEQVMQRLFDLSDRPINPYHAAPEKTAKEEEVVPVPRVKVIIHDGVTISVLADSQVNLEIVDIDKDYNDYYHLQEYEAQLYQDEALKDIEFSTAHFEEDDVE